MTENKQPIADKTRDKESSKAATEMATERHKEDEKPEQKAEKITKEQLSREEQQLQQQQQQQHPRNHHDRGKILSQFFVLLNIPRHHHQQHPGNHGGGSSNTLQKHSPQTPQASTAAATNTTCHLTVTGSCSASTNSSSVNNHKSNSININSVSTSISNSKLSHLAVVGSSSSEEQEYLNLPNAYLPRSSCVSFQSEILLLDLINGEINELVERTMHKDDYGTQRVYKKTSPNCALTLYLPSREITLSGSTTSVLRGIVFIDSRAVQGYNVFAQMMLTFRYGREDEEVMGLRFSNEAVMSVYQIWPRKEEHSKEYISPLQEALLKRLGEGAHPFTLTLTAQAPPSVQLVPAKRYYGAPIGTSYDVRCFVANTSDESNMQRTTVKMGVRVIYRTDVFSHGINGPENFATLVNNPVISPPATSLSAQGTALTAGGIKTNSAITPTLSGSATISESQTANGVKQLPHHNHPHHDQHPPEIGSAAETSLHARVRKSERGESFPKLRLSPKTFRFSNRFGRSKSEAEKCPTDSFHNYSKSFQEYDSVGAANLSGGPQGAVDKPFLLQDGRVALRASLDKSWYTHGESVCVTINVRNDSRKTVRKIRVCAIQHVDVCMFNNGKFKNVVADSDSIQPPPIEQHVSPGSTLNARVILKPQRGATKNWIALEDTLQKSTEPDEINADIAASALRTPHFLMQSNHSPNKCSSPGILLPPTALTTPISFAATNSDERNVFAIYVSYYVKVKLSLSSMGGELSLKLPFLLVHIDEEQRLRHEKENIQLKEVPAVKRNGKVSKSPEHRKGAAQTSILPASLERIESLDTESVHIKVTHVSSCDGDGVIEATIKAAEAKDHIVDEPQPSTSLACRRRRQSFMRSESIDHGLEDDLEAARAASLERVLHAVQVHSESQGDHKADDVALKPRDNVGIYGKT